MNENTVVRHSFATGIVMPGIHNRTDWDRHDSAVADAVNFTVGPSGEMIKRYGFRWLGPALHDDKPVRLIKFQFSQGQAYILEIGDEVMRFYTDIIGADGRPKRGMIVNDDETEYRLATPYTAMQASKITFAQDKDALFFAHWDKPLQMLARHGHADWRWSQVFDNVPDRVLAPRTVDFFDAASNGHNGFEYTVTSAKNVDGTLQESVGGYTPLQAGPATYPVISEQPQDNIASCLSWIDKYRRDFEEFPGFPIIPAEFDFRDVSTDQQVPRTNPTISETIGNINDKLFAILKLRYPTMAYANYGYYTVSIGTSLRVWEWYVISDTANTLWSTTYLVTRSNNSTSGVSSTLDDQWNGYVQDVNTTWVMIKVCLDIIDSGVAINGHTKDSIYNDIMNFIEHHNNNNSIKVSNHIKWSASEGADRYYVYRRPMEGENTSFYRIADVDATVSDFLDENISETVLMPETPTQGESQFNDENRYPALVSFYQQRLVLGATKEKPTTIWGSKTGIYTDFAVNLTGNEALYSAYEFKMASETSDPLKAILPLRTIYILTSGGAFVSTVSGAMNAGNVNFNLEAYRGASDVPPLLLDKNAIYTPVGQQTINALAYDFSADGFRDDNLLEHAQHLTENNIVVGLDFLRSPIDLILASLADGSVISCTYIPNAGFRAWTRHTTQGRILSSVAYTNDSGLDELWAVVERTLGDGTKKRYIEVLEDMRPFRGEPTAENSFYVDCGVSRRFDAPESVVDGLEHLEGLEVAVLADFSVQSTKTVRNGAVELDFPAEQVHVGLPYEAYLRTLDLEPQGVPTLRGTRRRVYKAQIEVHRTRDLSYSMNGGDSYDAIFMTGADFGQIPRPWSGDVPITGRAGTTKETYLELSSRLPLPCTINSIVAEIQYAG